MSEEVIYLWNGGRKTGKPARRKCRSCRGRGVAKSGLPCHVCMGDGSLSRYQAWQRSVQRKKNPLTRRRKQRNPTGYDFSGAYYRPVRKRGAARRPRYTRIWRGRSRAVFARSVPRGWGAVAKRLVNPRKYDSGTGVRVNLSKREVVAFKRTFPCSGLPDRAVFFEFDKRNGDLVDTNVSRKASDNAQVALADEAQKYAGL